MEKSLAGSPATELVARGQICSESSKMARKEFRTS